MNYEYNGHLTEEERIKQVSKEITSYYKEISLPKAKLIAELESPITEEVTEIIKFKRLYNILFIIQKDKILFNKIFIDLKNTYKKYLLSQKSDNTIDRIMEEIIKYVNHERIDFPLISEFSK